LLILTLCNQQKLNWVGLVEKQDYMIYLYSWNVILLS